MSKLVEEGNKKATLLRLKMLKEQLTKSKVTNFDNIYHLLGNEQAPNPTYCECNMEKFAALFSRSLLVPQNRPALARSYKTLMEEVAESGDYFFIRDDKATTADRRMIINFRTQQDAMTLARVLWSLSGVYNCFKFFVRQSNSETNESKRFKIDKMVIYFQEKQLEELERWIVWADLPLEAFVPILSSFYNIHSIEGQNDKRYTVGIAKETNPYVSFTEQCTIYILAYLCEKTPELIYKYRYCDYTVLDKHLAKDDNTFANDVFNNVFGYVR